MEENPLRETFDRQALSINEISKHDPEFISDKVFELHLHKLKDDQKEENGAEFLYTHIKVNKIK